MSGFRTTYEQKKWDSLRAQEKTALTRVMSGQGKPQDFKALENLVAQYDALAGQIMKRVLRSIEESVNKQLDAERKHRGDSGQEPLTEEQTASLMEKALADAWDNQGPELVVIIEESIVKALREQEARTQSEFSKRLQEQLGPKQEFTLDDVVAHLTDPNKDLAQWRYMQRRFAEIKDSLKGLEGLEDRLEERAETGALRAIRRYASGESEQTAHPRSGRTPKEVLNGMLASSQVPDEDKTEAANTARRFEAIVSESLRDQDMTLKDIRDRLDGLNMSDSDRRRQVDRDADAYSRRLKQNGTFGDRAKKSGGVGIMAGLGILGAKLLLSQLMGGRVWQELEKVFSSEGLKDLGTKFLSLLESAGKGIAKYIADQFTNAQAAAEARAGVKPSDPIDVRQSKMDVLKAEGAVEAKKAAIAAGADPSTVGLAGSEAVVEDEKKKLKSLQADHAASLSGASGKIGPPSGEWPSGPKSVMTPPSEVSYSPTVPNPPSTNPFPKPSGSNAGLGSGMFASNTAAITNSTTVNPVINPTLTPPVIGEGPSAGSGKGSPSANSSQAVGGAISNISNMQYRPSIDGSLGMVNVGMLVE